MGLELFVELVLPLAYSCFGIMNVSKIGCVALAALLSVSLLGCGGPTAQMCPSPNSDVKCPGDDHYCITNDTKVVGCCPSDASNGCFFEDGSLYCCAKGCNTVTNKTECSVSDLPKSSEVKFQQEGMALSAVAMISPTPNFEESIV